jgi:metal-dependent hydrolase (beta-lactamase superfamily II)
VAPCHCTGDEAIRLLAEDWGDAFVPVGVGKSITLPD